MTLTACQSRDEAFCIRTVPEIQLRWADIEVSLFWEIENGPGTEKHYVATIVTDKLQHRILYSAEDQSSRFAVLRWDNDCAGTPLGASTDGALYFYIPFTQPFLYFLDFAAV